MSRGCQEGPSVLKRTLGSSASSLLPSCGRRGWGGRICASPPQATGALSAFVMEVIAQGKGDSGDNVSDQWISEDGKPLAALWNERRREDFCVRRWQLRAQWPVCEVHFRRDSGIFRGFGKQPWRKSQVINRHPRGPLSGSGQQLTGA